MQQWTAASHLFDVVVNVVCNALYIHSFYFLHISILLCTAPAGSSPSLSSCSCYDTWLCACMMHEGGWEEILCGMLDMAARHWQAAAEDSTIMLQETLAYNQQATKPALMIYYNVLLILPVWSDIVLLCNFLLTVIGLKYMNRITVLCKA